MRRGVFVYTVSRFVLHIYLYLIVYSTPQNYLFIAFCFCVFALQYFGNTVRPVSKVHTTTRAPGTR